RGRGLRGWNGVSRNAHHRGGDSQPVLIHVVEAADTHDGDPRHARGDEGRRSCRRQKDPGFTGRLRPVACRLPNFQSGCAVTTPPFAPAPMRAPALYVSGFVDRETDGAVVPFNFRLPCPPSWDDRLPGAWAAERRARRAYFATLDSLRTG